MAAAHRSVHEEPRWKEQSELRERLRRFFSASLLDRDDRDDRDEDGDEDDHAGWLRRPWWRRLH